MTGLTTTLKEKAKLKIYIVNGYSGTGKTTFEEDAIRILKENGKEGFSVSTIDDIKEIAMNIGWDGRKNGAGRRLLSGLKQVLNEYNDFTMEHMKEKLSYIEWRNPNAVVFIDSREPEEIKRFIKELSATTVFVKRPIDHTLISNDSDRNVEDIVYDYKVDNTGTLKDLEFETEKFLRIEGLI